MKQKLVQEQTLQLKMNQSLLQAIQIMQFSSMELIEFIQDMAKENPLIEEVNYDYDIASFRASHKEQVSLGEINKREATVAEQLKGQLFTLNIPKDLLPVIEYGIDSLNDDGYLDVELNIWKEQCQTTTECVKEAINFIQQLEPPGIGARSLSECIVLQLKHVGGKYEIAEKLLNDHLEWIANENIELIAKHYQLTESEVEQLIEQIKSCHPRPGRLLENEKPEYIIPEANIYYENNQLKISFYNWHSPTIKINETYRNLLSEDQETVNYLKGKANEVEQLNKAIAYRTNTTEAVIQKITEIQASFFEYGASMLQPLTLKEIADVLNISISTVSRAINNKYVQTQFGVVPLKYFFQSGIKQGDGKETATLAIKQIMLEMIQHEDKQNPLSDQAIKTKLNDQYGIQIARRTVMKYRDQLQIPSSVKRRKRGGK